MTESSGGFLTRTFPIPPAFNAATVRVVSHKDGLLRVLSARLAPRPAAGGAAAPRRIAW